MKKWIIGVVILVAAVVCGYFMFDGTPFINTETDEEVTEQVVDSVESQERDTVELIEALDSITCDSIGELSNDTLK